MKLVFILLFLALAAAHGQQQQERIAILQTVDDGDSIKPSDLNYLTDRLRETAVNVLPKSRYGVMTTESIVAFLGSQERMVKECKAASCLAEIGRKVNADYVAQARVGRFEGDLTIKAELYSSKSGNLLGSFTGDSKSLQGLRNIIDKKAPALFKKLDNRLYLVNLDTEPSGADLSFDGEPHSSSCATPCKVEFPEGSVRITADLEQYETADTTVSIKQNNQKINIKLKPNFGVLEIKPAYLDGIGKNEQWNLTLNGQVFYSLENKLLPDKYKGELSHRCYEDVSFNIAVSKGRQQVFDAARHIKLKKGGLVLKAERDGKPVKEPVYVNGKRVGETPFSGAVPLCAEIEFGKSREKVDVELEHNGKVVHTHKYEYEILKERGNAYYEKGDYDRAIEEYTAALRIKPDYLAALYNRGNAYSLKGNPDRAIEDHTAALRIKPDDPEALYFRGLTYLEKGDYDRAIEDYNAALRIKPDYPEALFFRGLAYLKKGDYDRAIEDHTAALRIKPDYPEALYFRGLAYLKKGDYDRAIEDYNAALRIKPDYLDALHSRGIAYFYKGNYDRAIEEYEAVLRIDPNHAKARESLRLVHQKKAGSKNQKLATAANAAPKGGCDSEKAKAQTLLEKCKRMGKGAAGYPKCAEDFKAQKAKAEQSCRAGSVSSGSDLETAVKELEYQANSRNCRSNEKKKDANCATILQQWGQELYKLEEFNFTEEQNKFEELVQFCADRDNNVKKYPQCSKTSNPPKVNHDGSLPIFLDYVKYFPDGSSAPGMLYQASFVLETKGDIDQALALRKRLVEKYPNHTLSSSAWLRIGEYYYNKNKWADAIKAYEKITGDAAGVSKKEAAYALYHMAEAYYNRADYERAAQKFWEYIDGADKGKYIKDLQDAARAYMARILEDMQQ